MVQCLIHPRNQWWIFNADEDFTGLWGHENTQDRIYARSTTGLVVTFFNCPLLWVSRLQTEVSLSTIRFEYVVFFHSVRALLTLKSLIKEVIDNLVIKSEKRKFVPISTVYDYNNGALVVTRSPIMTPTSKHIAVKYHWFRQNVGNKFAIWKIQP